VKTYDLSRESYEDLQRDVYSSGLRCSKTGVTIRDWESLEDGGDYSSEPRVFHRIKNIESRMQNCVDVEELRVSAHMVNRLAKSYDHVHALPALRNIYRCDTKKQCIAARMVVAYLQEPIDEESNGELRFLLRQFCDSDQGTSMQVKHKPRLHELDAVVWMANERKDGSGELDEPVII
jgi:hypothetical protein